MATVPLDAIQRSLRELAEWRPAGGVLSVYVDIDPADRGEGWRIALRDQLRRLDGEAAARVLARLPAGAPADEGRTRVGFVEVGRGGREVWHGFQVRLGTVIARQGPSPHLTPLVRLLEEGGPLGVVLTSLERVRVLEWALGRIEELVGWELETTSLDWRERRAPQRNPQAGGTGVTAAGREQHMQRLEHNRERFLKQAGELIADRFGDRQWRRLIVFGEGELPRLLALGLGELRKLVHESRLDLIGVGAEEIRSRIAAEIDHLNREHEEQLVRRIEEAIGTGSGAALGPEEVLNALEQGRANHVVFDAGREFGEHDGIPLSERMISLALTTSAEVTPAEGLAARVLAKRGGAVALLRY